MIVAIGVDVDRTFATFLKHADEVGLPITCINLRAVVAEGWELELPPTSPAIFQQAGRRCLLPPGAAYYCRIIDLAAPEQNPADARRWWALTKALRAWLDAAPGFIVNRPSAGLHNGSKPLHEALIRRHGLRVPESVTASDPDILRAFARSHACVSKTICGMRADTVLVEEAELADFAPQHGPIHLQRRIVGDDVRVHVLGTEVHALCAPADAVDYRRAGAIEAMVPIELPKDLADRLVNTTASFGLAFAGWDFKRAPDGTFWCLEANPMPGYGPYDEQSGGNISAALVRLLKAGLA